MQLIQGDCLDVLKTIPDNSVDSLVTDPPAGISFMGKDWDGDKGGRKEWCAWMENVMRECMRVLKPGGHGLVWSIPRTSHWTATALEDAGFEVRDCITHLFGSGFPKSLDISKAIDKAVGAKREVLGKKDVGPDHRGSNYANKATGERMIAEITAPATDSAKEWEGWGTALKPAAEFWWLIRKPLSEKTVAANVQKWGTGGINIDACRIGHDEKLTSGRHVEKNRSHPSGYKDTFRTEFQQNNQGRFPANLVLSHSEDCTEEACGLFCAVKMLDEQSGISKSIKTKKSDNRKTGFGSGGEMIGTVGCHDNNNSYSDSGGASRFFYCAKISTSERNYGLDDFPDRAGGVKNTSGRGFSETDPNKPIITKNHHPTVKAKKLMGYLIKLITPPNGIVLDPFMGSGSTGIAAKENGFDFMGIEREKEYFEIAKARIDNA
jgi:DNA modification methylase